MYCLDTGVFIHSWHFWYAKKNYPTFWTGIEQLAEEKRLGIPPQVLEELGEEKDELYKWCKDREEILIWEPSEFTEAFYSEMVNSYPGLATSHIGVGRNYADLYVVATAQIYNAAVVTTEKLDRSKKIKIPDICKDHDIDCLQPYDIIKNEGWVFRHKK